MTENEPQTLLDSLPEDFQSDPTWLRELRGRAADSLRATGLPTKKTEAWRFTPVRSVVETPFSRRSVEPPSIAPEPGAGVTIRRLREVLDAEPTRLEGLLGWGEDTHFAALNTALFTDGLWIDVAPGTIVETPLQLSHAIPDVAEPRVSYPRILLTVGAGSELTVIESYEGSAKGPLTNSFVEINVGANAKVDHVRVHDNAGLQVGRVDVRQSADSTYRSVVCTLRGELLRFDVRVLLEGKGARCQLDGAYLVGGTDHVDHHTLVEHRAAHCRSDQNYRGIADDRGTAVFDGIVVVQRDAQKTEAHQQNRNLLLSDTATIHTKPHLEIDADDVVCSHGATVGALDADQLFYLRARGIPAELARGLLTYAFVEQVVDEVEHEPTRERLRNAVLERIPQGQAIRGNA